MRHRLVLLVTSLVVAAHGLVMLGPFEWYAGRLSAAGAQPAWLQAVWVQPLAVAPPPVTSAAVPTATASPATAPLPIPQRAKRPSKQPRAMPRPPSAPPAAALPAATPVAALAVAQAAPQPDRAEVLEAPAADPEPLSSPATSTPAPAPSAGPQLQVHNASGARVDVAVPADGAALPAQQRLQFKVHGWVKGMEYHAQAQLEWELADGRYQAHQRISAFLLGSMEQTSSGALTAQGLQPHDFADRRFAKRRHVRLDWSSQQAHFDPARDAAPIGPGAQDRLSVFLQLATLLQAMPALRSPGTRIDIPTLGSRRLQIWSFVVEGEESLELPAGPTATLRLQRLPQPGDEDSAQLWVNPAQNYLPARIRVQERSGDVMELSLR